MRRLLLILIVPCAIGAVAIVPYAYRRLWPPYFLWFPEPVKVQSTGTGSPILAGCPVFPPDNAWNTPIEKLPVHRDSDVFLTVMGATHVLHVDLGLPITVADASTPKARVIFDNKEESDEQPYPIPPNVAIESGSDKHALILDQSTCKLYELFAVTPGVGNVWKAGSGAIFDLKSNQLRPNGPTSADAAGLPILPGLVRYDEVQQGEIRHALRFTTPATRKFHVWPARHDASGRTAAEYPPMGLRVRLRQSFDISGFHPAYQVILIALKKYGMILADNGGPWFISGVPDNRWNNRNINRAFKKIHGADFEVVDTSSMMVAPDSAQAHRP